MEIFEYLPQLIVAYDGNDKFANLIHVKKANKDNNYYCPCCGGVVKPRALDSIKEQSHYYHKTGNCTKESQLHFFCKNWLFEKESKFYINNELFEIDSIDVEKAHYTPFGNYKPDVTINTTCGRTIYFEMFFTNRKNSNDYFCKWDALGNSVVEINIKEYMFKTDKDIIPSFTYLYHEGVCYSKTYIKRDLYANTIAKIKHELTRQKILNYKVRIEQLDWFWREIQNNTKESILDIVSKMEYEDMVSCYEIIKRKQCVAYLKNDVLNIINQKVISDVRDSLDIKQTKEIYFDLEHIQGRTYKAGMRLNLKTKHISYNKLYIPYEDYHRFKELTTFPKIVFSKNMFNIKELTIPEEKIDDLKNMYQYLSNYKEAILKYEDNLSVLEKEKYKIRVNNNLHTVLVKKDDKFELLLENYYIKDFDIQNLIKEIELKTSNNENKEFINNLFLSNEYNSFMSKIKKYDNFNIWVDINRYYGYNKNGIYFKLYVNNHCIYDTELEKNIEDFIRKTNECELYIENFMKSYSLLNDLVYEINNCRNNFWRAELSFIYSDHPVIIIDQKYFTPNKYLTLEKIYLKNFNLLRKEEIISEILSGMNKVLKNMELCGYRVMEATGN